MPPTLPTRHQRPHTIQRKKTTKTQRHRPSHRDAKCKHHMTHRGKQLNPTEGTDLDSGNMPCNCTATMPSARSTGGCTRPNPKVEHITSCGRRGKVHNDSTTKYTHAQKYRVSEDAFPLRVSGISESDRRTGSMSGKETLPHCRPKTQQMTP